MPLCALLFVLASAQEGAGVWEAGMGRACVAPFREGPRVQGQMQSPYLPDARYLPLGRKDADSCRKGGDSCSLCLCSGKVEVWPFSTVLPHSPITQLHLGVNRAGNGVGVDRLLLVNLPQNAEESPQSHNGKSSSFPEDSTVSTCRTPAFQKPGAWKRHLRVRGFLAST